MLQQQLAYRTVCFMMSRVPYRVSYDDGYELRQNTYYIDDVEWALEIAAQFGGKQEPDCELQHEVSLRVDKQENNSATITA